MLLDWLAGRGEHPRPAAVVDLTPPDVGLRASASTDDQDEQTWAGPAHPEPDPAETS